MKKKLLIYISFFIALLLFFYGILFYNNNYWKNTLPMISAVKPFTFTNQYNKIINEQKLTDHITIVNFFFATCDGVCPKMNNKLKKIYDEFKSYKNFQVFSHTVDPDQDTPEKLLQYAHTLLLDTPNQQWFFLTGDKKNIYKQARESYVLDDLNNNIGHISEQFIHTQLFALVDKNAQVRGVYDSFNENDMMQLKQDIKELLNE